MNLSLKHLKHIRYKKKFKGICEHFTCIQSQSYNYGDPEMCTGDCIECDIPVKYGCTEWCGNYDEYSKSCLRNDMINLFGENHGLTDKETEVYKELLKVGSKKTGFKI